MHSCEKKLLNTTQAEHAQTKGRICPKHLLITVVVSRVTETSIWSRHSIQVHKEHGMDVAAVPSADETDTNPQTARQYRYVACLPRYNWQEQLVMGCHIRVIKERNNSVFITLTRFVIDHVNENVTEAKTIWP